MNTALILRATERLDTAVIGISYTDDRDADRAGIIELFLGLATDIGKIASPLPGGPDWLRIQRAMHELRWQAVQAHKARSRTFAHAGAEAALVVHLHAFAAVLGFTLADAATAIPDDFDDETARDAIEGQWKDAAE